MCNLIINIFNGNPSCRYEIDSYSVSGFVNQIVRDDGMTRNLSFD